MIISRTSIAKQAQQDARDAMAGHRTHNPYDPLEDAHAVYAAAFARALHELQAEPETEATA